MNNKGTNEEKIDFFIKKCQMTDIVKVCHKNLTILSFCDSQKFY